MSDKYWIIEEEVIDEDTKRASWKQHGNSILSKNEAERILTSMIRNHRDRQLEKIVGLQGAKRGRNADYAESIKRTIIFDKYRMTTKYARTYKTSYYNKY